MTRFAREFCTENSLQDAISTPVCFFYTKNQIAEDDARFDSSTSIRRQYDAVGFFLDVILDAAAATAPEARVKVLH
jgi:hypothetical protein